MILLPLLLALAAPAQDRLPPANALPPPDADTAAVLAPIERLFAGLAARDAAQIMAQVRPEGRAIAVSTAADGSRAVRSMSWAEFTDQLKGGTARLEERLVAPAVEIDGDIAMVWSSYVFNINGKFSHCGTDHFNMVRDAGGWKVATITWTQRTTDCPAG